MTIDTNAKLTRETLEIPYLHVTTHFIDGAWREALGDETNEVTDPATNTVWGSVPVGTEDDVKPSTFAEIPGASAAYGFHDKICQPAYHGCMATMNVSLPDELKEFVETQVEEHGYVSSSEFLRELIRREQDRTQLRALLLQGMESGTGSDMNDQYFQRMRARIRNSNAA